jgi:hypothetical protein
MELFLMWQLRGAAAGSESVTADLYSFHADILGTYEIDVGIEAGDTAATDLHVAGVFHDDAAADAAVVGADGESIQIQRYVLCTDNDAVTLGNILIGIQLVAAGSVDPPLGGRCCGHAD